MWPTSGLEIVEVCGGACAAPDLFSLRIAGVKADGARPHFDDLFVALREPAYDFDGHDWVVPYLRAGAALALVSADWPQLPMLPAPLRQRCVVVPDSLQAFRRLAAWLRRRFTFPIIAIGGSNGKTTTRDMLAALLSSPGFRVTHTPGNLNGHTGIPLTLVQREHSRDAPPHALVVEIGIDAPHAMADHAALIAPDVAVLTSLGPEHLAGLGSWDTAVAEELRLFDVSSTVRRIFLARDAKVRERIFTARQGDIIVCDDDTWPEVSSFEALSRRGVALLRYRVFDSDPLASEVALRFFEDAHTRESPTCSGQLRVPMPGRHNADNFAAAFAAALAIGRSPDDLLRGWPGFTPPAMRCQPIALPDGGILIDDSYNASPSSMTAALALLESPAFVNRRKLVFLGDMLDLGASSRSHHLALREPLRALGNTRLFLFGDAMCGLHRELETLPRVAMALPASADPRAFLNHPEVSLAEAVVLIKGSRGMRLDRLVNAILHRSETAAASSTGDRWRLQFSVDDE